MIELPDLNRSFEYENGFYLTAPPSRVGKLLAHYEFYKQARKLPGAVVECGVFKGCSLIRFAMFRQLLGDVATKPIVGFDTFGEFPQTSFQPDIALRKRHLDLCGPESISRQQLLEVLARHRLNENLELVEGDILTTLPAYLNAKPGLEVALLNLDVDIYEPSKVILEMLYPRLVPGGILLLDDYKVFPGETKAVDDYFGAERLRIKRSSFGPTPHYLIKE